MHSNKGKYDSLKHDSGLNPPVLKLFLINDDVNSFEYVIEVLMDLCQHTYIQAEQCAMLTHFKGSCSIKSGTRNVLEQLKKDLIQHNLSAEIR